MASTFFDDWSSPGPAARWLLTTAAASLAAVLWLDLGLGIRPCVLCLWQRGPYVIVIALMSAAVLAGPTRVTGQSTLLGLSALTLWTGAGIAVLHLGVEQGWWTGTEGCGVPAAPTSFEALRAQLMAAPVVRCDEVAWSLFGISLPGYNAAWSLGLGGGAAVAALRGAGALATDGRAS